MKNMNVKTYWEILGKVFEWICHEGNREVSLSMSQKVGDKYELKTRINAHIDRSELCIATMQDALKYYDQEHGTDYFKQITEAIEKTKKGVALVRDECA